ncbi:MAG: aconitase family protein, partial [Candidatus Acidiferrales bacterium]
MAPQTLYEKIWDKHVVHDDPDLPSLIYIDRHIVHDVSAQAFAGIAAANRKVRRPDLTLGVVD